MIANSGSDENKKYAGGKDGDQTGLEYGVIKWYSRPWACVLRYENKNQKIQKKVREMIAKVAKAAANNDNIGYDQNERTTYYTELKKVGWKPSKIKVKCEDDCSAGVSAAVIAAGYRCDVADLKKVSPNNTTSTLRAALKAAGFTVLTDQKYLTSDKYLRPGDILLKDGSHTAINLDAGSGVKKSTTKKEENPKETTGNPYTEPKKTINKGDIGESVKWVQYELKEIKLLTKIDGIYGNDTANAVKKFKDQKKWKPTLKVGKRMRNALKKMK